MPTRGSAFFNLRTTGRAGHASRPDLGSNAIDKMLDVLAVIRTEFAAEFAAHRDPLLGSSTLSIGTIRGGTKTNIIPDFCEASVDMRFVPEHYQPGIIERFRTRLDSFARAWRLPRFRPRLSIPTRPIRSSSSSANAAPSGRRPMAVRRLHFRRTGHASRGPRPRNHSAGHTKDEHIAVEDLHRGVEFFAKFLSIL